MSQVSAADEPTPDGAPRSDQPRKLSGLAAIGFGPRPVDTEASSRSAESPAERGSAARRARRPQSRRPSGTPPAFVNFARQMALLVWQNRLATVAVLLLGVGGAAYPPLWLLGAVLTLVSHAWDGRDKAIVLAGTVNLVIVGSAIVLVFGGPRITLGSYAYEAWLAAGRLSRVAAVLGAGYLLWRLRAGPRPRKQPPWEASRRVR